MKRIGLILSTVLLLAVTLYVAYQQGAGYSDASTVMGLNLISPFEDGSIGLIGFQSALFGSFSAIINSLTAVFGGSLVTAIIVLALIIEFITLYPAVNIQLMQKKIHMFHKKLVDRFHSGELSMSKTKRELDVLYSVNERIHSRGAWLISFQLVIFVLVLMGLQLLALQPSVLAGSFNSFNFSLLTTPVNSAIPVLTGLSYLLYALIRIHIKQSEDYISMKQVSIALAFAVLASTVVFVFSSQFAVLLSVYFLTQITFASTRYLIVEGNSREWGKFAQRDLIKQLRTSRIHKSKLEHVSRKFNHSFIVRNLNLHLLGEAMSMSLAIVIALNALVLV